MSQALTANAAAHLERYIIGDRKRRIVRSLASVYPKAITGRQLMIRAGLPLHSSPVTAFVELCNSFTGINWDLPSHGWQAVRDGGTPDALYWLSPAGGG